MRPYIISAGSEKSKGQLSFQNPRLQTQESIHVAQASSSPLCSVHNHTELYSVNMLG